MSIISFIIKKINLSQLTSKVTSPIPPPLRIPSFKNHTRHNEKVGHLASPKYYESF